MLEPLLGTDDLTALTQPKSVKGVLPPSDKAVILDPFHHQLGGNIADIVLMRAQ